MSDLISRSELLEELKSLKIVLNGKQIFSDDAKDTVLRIVNEQPIAYDIDAVVSELRRRSGNGYRDIDGDYVPPMIKTEKAIEIVKHGVVADDVCEWKSGKSNDEWKPSCEPNSTYNVFGVAWFRKCPYCGKKINVVDK